MKPAYNFRWDNDVQEQISRLRDCRRFPTWCECQQTGTVAQVMLILGFFIKFQSWWTYLMSGTLRLRVHSWELTNESEEIIDRIISIQHRTHFAINIQCPVSSQSNWGLFDLLLSTINFWPVNQSLEDDIWEEHQCALLGSLVGVIISGGISLPAQDKKSNTNRHNQEQLRTSSIPSVILNETWPIKVDPDTVQWDVYCINYKPFNLKRFSRKHIFGDTGWYYCICGLYVRNWAGPTQGGWA